MNERNSQLQQFFAGYFNQDWDIKGATSWSDVMDDYIAENDRGSVLNIVSHLRSWMSESNADQRLPIEFGCDYDPGPDGMSEWTWVGALADYLEERV